ncbi:MAG: tRNA (N(6)-L-threonylcarbamoyladenosine(37)-C(2))-methylthiotransferase MtaB [Clostridia bacterium]|nr:tRNA (N(6)-L-threonylcarbamoyladenosine(37)-C(2))-methylthiotransferase MtaB [Clostridia bacterium]
MKQGMSEERAISERTVAFHTLGCKVNQYDTQAMRERFERAGYRTVGFDEAADVYVVNTCTVTGTGDKKSMQTIRRCHRRNPNAAIVVTGCLAQRAADELTLPGVRLVLGTQRRAEVVELLEQALGQDCALIAVSTLRRAPFERLTVHANEGHTRATMKIQEGCDRFCSYCIIPSVRGPIRSRPLDDIRAEARSLADEGFAEIVLTGIHLTSYGRDMGGEVALTDAIRAVHEVDGIRRIRLGSLEPVIVTPAFVEELKGLPKACHQFHLALQSGSDTVLRRMRRRYTSGEFLTSCRLLREAFDDCTLTTDVMTGFPGETEEEFAQTMATCESAGFARMHVFPYSEREGTKAAQMEGSVPKALREERARRLIALGRELERAALEARIGKTEEVLFEETDEAGRSAGYTGSYLRVSATGGWPGAIRRVRLTGIENGELVGECEPETHTNM